MEHIIQIAVSCDDERIARLAEESAARQLVDKVREHYEGGGRVYRARPVEKIIADDATRQVVDLVIGEHLDKIADMAAERLSRSKAFREKVAASVSDRVAEEAEDGER